MRRARTRKLAVGAALLATILHVAFVSLHLAMMATMAMAAPSDASVQASRFVICGPSRLADDAATPSGAQAAETEGLPAAPAGPDGATCPLCTSTTSPVLVLPDLPQPAYTALATTTPITTTGEVLTARYETAPCQSRGPPPTT